ncbi:hypothetical protein PAXRUDRAFT_72826, partial [Paxillus rubicundulus Ve08.2h10]
MTTIINVKTINQLNGFSLKLLDLSVHFLGHVSLQDIPEHIPIQVSICLGDEWIDQLCPIVEALPADNMSESADDISPELFPFLPLPSQFDPYNGLEWQSLAKEIEHWLLQDLAFNMTHPGCYILIQELFWMAFVAVFPSFPYGQWPNWDLQILMDGDFILDWVADLDEPKPTPVPAIVRKSAWEQLKVAVDELL